MGSNNRVRNSIINTIANVVCNVLLMLVGIISQAIFIKLLNVEYLGINGLFSNILSILGIMELGIGNAIVFSLFKPVAEDDQDTIKSLLRFYKKAYTLIGLLILVVGLILTPFIPVFVGKIEVDINIKLVYILFLLQSVSTYILSYRTSIFIASQQNYVIKINALLSKVVLSILQLTALYFTKNYYLYLVIAIINSLVFNFIVYKYAECQFIYLKDKNVKNISPEMESSIFRKIKGLFFHKIGSFMVLGTDNIVISMFIDVLTVGLYFNYNTIITSVGNLFSQIITAASSSVGNLIATESKEKCFEVFEKMHFLNYWLSVFASVSILCIIQPFIRLWIGEEYLLNILTVIVLSINFYQTTMRCVFDNFKDSAGIWYEDKYIPLIESFVNIFFSVVLVKKMGLIGVFVGTFISGLVLWSYSYPRFVYKKIFDKSYLSYAKKTISGFCLLIIIGFVTLAGCSIVVVDNNLLQCIWNGLMCLIIPNTILLLVYHKNQNFIYYKNLAFSILKKAKKE